MKKIFLLSFIAVLSLFSRSAMAAVIQVSAGELNLANDGTGIVYSATDGDIIELTTSGGAYTWTTKITAQTKSLTIRAAAGLAARPVITLPTGILYASNGNTTPITISFEGIEFNGNGVATQLTSAKSNNTSPNTGNFQVSMNNCYVRNMGTVPSGGLFAYSATGHTGYFSALSITNSIFDGMAYAVYGGAANALPSSITLNNCYFSNITTKAVNAQIAMAGGVTIDHCTFENCASVASSAEVLIKASVAIPTIIKNTLFANRNTTSTTANTFGQVVGGSPNTNNAYYQSTPTASIYPATITGSGGVAAITSNPSIVDRIATGAAYLTGASDGAVIGYKGYSASTPTISKSVSSISSGMGYAVGGSSTAQTFTVEGTNMTEGILVTAPANFEVSSDNTTFVDSYTVGTAGTISSTTVYVRAKSGLSAATYTGSINLTSAGATAHTVSLSAIVTGPLITRSVATLTGLNYGVGFGPSAEQSFTVTSSALSADITVTAPTNYEVSLSSGTGFASTVNVAMNGTNTPVYVRQIAGLALGSYSGDVSLASTGAATVTVAVSGSVGTPLVRITNNSDADKSSLTVTSVAYGAGAGVSVTNMYVKGNYLQGDVTVTAPTGVEVSKDNTTFSDAVVYTVTNQAVVGTGQLWARLKAGLNTDTYSGNIVASSAGSVNKTVLTSGSVTGGAVIWGASLGTTVVSTVASAGYAGNGPTSPEKTVVITASGLSSDVTITPSTNYEISLTTGTGFVSTPIAVANDGFGAIAATTVYIRLKAGLALGAYNESITLTATGANTRTINITGDVTSLLTSGPSTLTDLNALPGGAPNKTDVFTVSGANLTGDITITPPANFVISTELFGTFSSTPIVLSPISGNVASTNIYVQAESGLPQTVLITGDVTIATPGVTTRTVTLSGTVDYTVGLNAGTNNMKVKTVSKGIEVSGVANGTAIEVYNNLGQKITSTLSSDSNNTIMLSAKGIYIVKVGSAVRKVSVR